MVSFTDIVIRGKMRHATPVTACLAIYITSCTSSTYFSASGDSERLRPLMEHNNRDVWGAWPDGIDIRMHEDLYQQIHLHFPECSVKVRDLEAFVRDWEKKSM